MQFALINLAYGQTDDLQAFRQEQIKELQVCKYVREGLRIETSDPKPELFANVQRIFLLPSESLIAASEAEGSEVITRDNMLKLAACTLQMRFTSSNQSTKKQSKLIYLPTRVSPVDSWPEAKDPDNLFISVDARIVKNSADPQSSTQTVLLQARYFRPQHNMFANLTHHCSEVISYSGDREKLQKDLSVSMRTCLYKPYVSSAAANPKQ
jgi:hypothetical protein